MVVVEVTCLHGALGNKFCTAEQDADALGIVPLLCTRRGQLANPRALLALTSGWTSRTAATTVFLRSLVEWGESNRQGRGDDR